MHALRNYMYSCTSCRSSKRSSLPFAGPNNNNMRLLPEKKTENGGEKEGEKAKYSITSDLIEESTAVLDLNDENTTTIGLDCYGRQQKRHRWSASSGRWSLGGTPASAIRDNQPEQQQQPAGGPPMTVAALGYTMVICGHSADDARRQYHRRLEKVKFGVPIASAFTHDIPATLLVLLLKVNKEGPLKKDIWRAPGNVAQVRKLAHIMQHGRLVNIANFSVYTAASVIKKFLAKLPGGIFGLQNEENLFETSGMVDIEEQRRVFFRVVQSLPIASQHLLVLLFGTFRSIADDSEMWGTRMTSEAIGVSVAPSLFHTCIHDGHRATVDDVKRFKAASDIVTKIINGFGFTNLFPRECYEFYARITGRTLRIENWLFTFHYPARTFSQPEVSTIRHGDHSSLDEILIEESPGPSTSANIRLVSRPSQLRKHRYSSSLAEVLMHSDAEDDHDGNEGSRLIRPDRDARTMESTRSLSYLEWVHEKQTRRMRTRSEWFLSPVPTLPTSSKSVEFEMCVPFPVAAILNQRPLAPISSPPAYSSIVPAVPPTPPSGNGGGGGIVRRRSWRTHYVRPNRSLDPEESAESAGRSKAVITPTTRSTPGSLGHLSRRGLLSDDTVALLSEEAMKPP